ncbi:tyrosine-type recombinase/integrase [Aliiruegeria sabulilitoris]|uniref:tyrosine-type recombinase/integrase n=1 Tax=Aliiruegeria sabulilitoris TaxID=1510458 RepID=UPI0008331DFA|nr:integrase arm-type DNA-binding domain-containing protein [Aliiruegeria sabulilitoris]
MSLTETAIKSVRPSERIAKLSDGEGLQLHIHPNGSKLWRLAYRFGGKQKTLALGKWPDVTVKEARKRRSKAKATLADGLDPSQERQRGDRKGPPTWAEVADEYVDFQRKRGRAPKTLGKLSCHVEKTKAAFGDRPIAEVRASDVLALLRDIEADGKHTTAASVRSLCSRVFRYAAMTDRAETDPAAALSGALVAPQSEGYPAIYDRDEIGGLIRAIRGYRGEPMTATGLLLCAYTFLRPGEVTKMHWADVDFVARQIVIPTERMKKPRPHVVPLSDQVASLLRDIERLTGGHRYVLWSLRSSSRPISDNTLNAALRRLGYSKQEMVAHGFRKIASTLLHEEGWNTDWIERQLAHIERNKVRAAYDKSEHIEGRTEMMQAYADLLDKLAETPKR